MSRKKMLCEKGSITPALLIILAVFFVFAVSLMNWSVSERKSVVKKERGNEALQVAEAGISYYQWHLAHDEDDYKDGNNWCCQENPGLSAADCGNVCGPYIHVYKDYNEMEIGSYALLITPPAVGSTIMKVESEGRIHADNTAKKTIVAQLGKMSVARYSLLSASPFWIGDTERTSGPLHSNGGIRFDGVCDAEVTTSVDTYNAYEAGHSFDSDDTSMPGIWGSTDPDVTRYWDKTTITDFTLFTPVMAEIKQATINAGGTYYFPHISGKQGYRLVFRNDGKISVSVVNSTTNKVKYYEAGQEKEDYEKIQSTSAAVTYNMPANGLIFVEDNVWVEGTVNGRATVAASKFASNPANYAKIIINNSINYVSHDGGDVLGLMAEGELLVPRHAPNPLNIDAVMLSQKSHVYVRNYKSSYKSAKDGSITVYGGIVTNLFWTWSYTPDGVRIDNGYVNTRMTYDNHLTFGPPPAFPTEGDFKIISWAEKK